MSLPIEPPFVPMEAKSAEEIPAGPDWQYEPKWDGFRCLVFRENSEVVLQSKAGQPLQRYFPEVVSSTLTVPASCFVIDCELVIPVNGSLSFDDLLLRIHPAASRVNKLAKEHPGMLIAFDLLVDEHGHSRLNLPLRKRRALLEGFSRRHLSDHGGIRLSPATASLEEARGWLRKMGGSIDGIMAKKLDAPYEPGARDAMLKVKFRRTIDCVVGGFRYAAGKRVVGSLLLGLYNDKGLLDHVGFTSGIKGAERETLTRRLEQLIEPPGFTGRTPGGPSRWSKKVEEWHPLAPKLVVEVEFDHFSGGRFRHGTRLLRWRPDKPPRQCTMEHVRQEGRSALALL